MRTGRKAGEGLVQAMEHIPSPYFDDDFDLGLSEPFLELRSGVESRSSLNIVIQENLSNYLDVVEVR